MAPTPPTPIKHIIQTSVNPEDPTIQSILGMLDTQDSGLRRLRDELPGVISLAMKEAMVPVTARLLTEEERDYVKAATKIAVQRLQFRDALIEKSLTALLFSFFAAVATGSWLVLTEFLRNHGWK